jgi:hypothetical protein
MKTPLALALAVSLALGASPALAGSSSVARHRAFSTHFAPWRQADRPHHGHGLVHHRHGFVHRGHGVLHHHRGTGTIAPRARGHVLVPAPTRPVFVPAHWAWSSHGWVWVSGHWLW